MVAFDVTAASMAVYSRGDSSLVPHIPYFGVLGGDYGAIKVCRRRGRGKHPVVKYRRVVLVPRQEYRCAVGILLEDIVRLAPSGRIPHGLQLTGKAKEHGRRVEERKQAGAKNNVTRCFCVGGEFACEIAGHSQAPRSA